MRVQTIQKRQTDRNVAAYARVSTLAESQEESYETQVKYYTEYITQEAGWNFVKVYADRGISGTSAEKRPGFMEMIRDAEAGRIDLILCKSVSRFSRNYEEAQKYMHLLKSLGVEVQFEKEGLSTFDPQTDMMIGALMAVAQQDSKSISENIRWAYKRLGDQGIRHVGNNHLLGYDEIDGEMTPNKDRWIIELIYQRYAEGKDISQILVELREKGAKTLRKHKDFSHYHVRSILKNEVYAGDRNMWKTPSKNYLTKKVDPTVKRESHYIRDHHTPIISRELWDKVQERLQWEEEHKTGWTTRRIDSHPYFNRIICGICGQPYRRTFYRLKTTGKNVPMWKCINRFKGKCWARVVSESEVAPVLEKADKVKVTEFSLEAL